MKTQPEYWTAARMARKADLPTPKVLKKIHDGVLVPDLKLDRFFYFHPARLQEVKSLFKPQMENA